MRVRKQGLKSSSAALAAWVTLTGAAVAASPSTTNPDAPVAWQKTPTAEQVAQAYPVAARSSNSAGKAMVNCVLQPDGRLRACKVVSEEPAGAGFGQAALGLTSRFTGYNSVAPTDFRVDIPIAFSGGPGAPRLVIGPTSTDYQPLIAKAATVTSVTKAEVMLNCKVGDKGVLTGCAATSESPAGLGLGDMAVKLGPKFVASLWGANGRPTLGTSVTVPLVFAFNEPPKAAPASKATP
jgi:TonB family protein